MRSRTMFAHTQAAHLLAAALIAVAPVCGHTQEAPPDSPDPAPEWGFPDDEPVMDTDGSASSLVQPADPQQGAPVPLMPPSIGGGVWLSEGPGPALFGQVEAITPGPDEVVGAIHTVVAHPTNPDIVFVGGVNGGIWRTTNATDASPFWEPLIDFETSLSIGALEYDPSDVAHMTLVAGVGRYSSFAQLGGVRTGRLLESIDGGTTWAQLPGFIGSASPVGISGLAPRGATIVATANTSDAFACSDVGIWRSVDGGATFTKISLGSVPPGPEGIAFDLAGNPTSPGTLYTALTFVPTCTGGFFPNGVYKSTDTGLTWTKVSSPAMDALIVDGTTNNVEIAFHGSNVFVDIIQSGRPVGVFHSPDGGVTWAAMDLPRTPEGAPLPIGVVFPGSPVFIDTSPTPHGLSSGMEVEIMGVGSPAIDGVWRTSVAGAFLLQSRRQLRLPTPWSGTGTWVKVVGVSPKDKPGAQGSIHASIRVDPSRPSVVYLGGDRQDFPFPNFLGALDFSGRLFRGDTAVAPTGSIPSPQWEHLTHLIGPAPPGGGTISGSAPHADSREMAVDADGDLIEVDDGGVYRRTSPLTNAGDWFSINGNIQVTEQHDIAYDSVSDIIISGNQDTGTTQQMVTNGLTWESVSTADGGDVAVDDLTVPGKSTRFSSFQNLGAFRRRAYDAANSLLSEVFPTLTPTGGTPTLIPTFVTPVQLNAMTPTSLLIVGCNNVYESFDQGGTITNISGPSDPGCAGGGITGFPQNAVAYGSPSNPDVVWIGLRSSVFNRFAPPGAALTVTATGFPGGTVTDVVVDPIHSPTAYVSDATDVYQTHDGGTTWTLMTGNLTDTRIGSLAIDPTGGRLFAGGREGVFVIPLPAPAVAAVGPFTWGKLGTGLPNAPVWDIEWDDTDGVLVVGTLGRGAWVLQEDGACGKPDTLIVNNQQVFGVQLERSLHQDHRRAVTSGPVQREPQVQVVDRHAERFLRPGGRHLRCGYRRSLAACRTGRGCSEGGRGQFGPDSKRIAGAMQREAGPNWTRH